MKEGELNETSEGEGGLGEIPTDGGESFACFRKFTKWCIEFSSADCITGSRFPDIARDEENEPVRQPSSLIETHEMRKNPKLRK
jgi:hypothetical protein